jgi:predicted SnoaL-like aldol condensation-catalyzing enzyme
MEFLMTQPRLGFRVQNGIALIEDSLLYSTWWEREDYAAALTASQSSAAGADKRLIMDFEIALARTVSAGRIEQDIDNVLSKFLDADYKQHDPGIANGPRGLAHWFRTVAVHFPGYPPPPVGLIAEQGLVSVLISMPPAPQLEWEGLSPVFICTVFRVNGGRLVEHWGGGKP